MKVLGIVSQKGGSGKTTLACHLSVQAQMEGYGPVALMDTDPQGSLFEWRHARASEQPLFISTSSANLKNEIPQVKAAGVRLLIIDTPPAISSVIGNVIEKADLVLIPARPSPNDLRAIGATLDLVNAIGKQLAFVINGAVPRSRIATDAVLALTEHGPVAPTIIHHRVGFAASMIDGRTVMEMAGRSRSSVEIAQLWHYIRQRLAKTTAKSATAPWQARTSSDHGLMQDLTSA